jgi:hypothetical protein
MQIDYDYLKRLMEAFTEAPRPTTDIVELQKLGLWSGIEKRVIPGIRAV